MYKRMRWQDIVFDAVNFLLLTIFIIIILYPIVYIVLASFSDPMLLKQNRSFLVTPLGFTLEGYKIVLQDPGIISGYMNTILYVVTGVLFSMTLTIMGAFVLSRRNLLWKKAIMIMITITMFFGGGLIPFFLLVRDIGLNGSWLALIIPYGINTWNMIIMRTGFQSIPITLEEAAYMDGASPLSVLINVIIPLSKATIAVILLYYIVGSWNAWFPAMIFLKERSQYPLQLVIREILVLNDMSNMQQNANVSSLFTESSSYRELVKYSTIIISSFPIMMLYPFLQKYFVQGIMLGSLKG